ncbi:MAG TPA: DUF167 domain-containing protein [Burkholderiaceae bacterium]|nr:DUF167 domain-containing protein [Burkholderiaceae bacterium]
MVAVIPNARQTEAVGLHDGALRVRLRAPALEGRANDALIAWVAAGVGVPRRDVEIRQGQSSRRKRLRLQCPLAQLESWLNGLGIASS